MNQIKIFENPEFGKVRTVEIDGKPYLIGKDVAEALGYSNTRKALADHVDEEDKGVTKCDTLGGKQELTVINESGLYSLILSSKLESAKRFKRWVTSEVLPSIRKSGGYIAGQEQMTDSELMAKALLVAQKQIEERNAQIERMRPKEIFADAVSASQTTILIGELAKLIRQNGVDIGQNRLFSWLRENGYLVKRKGTDYNQPTQKSADLGILTTKETIIAHSNGSTEIKKTVKVTGKGQQYFINKFLAGAQS
ncbi:MAG: phage antirepressor [Coprococcus sp.]